MRLLGDVGVFHASRAVPLGQRRSYDLHGLLYLYRRVHDVSRPRVWIPRLTRFVMRGMISKLREPHNEAKSDWRELPRAALLKMLRDNVVELMDDSRSIGGLDVVMMRAETIGQQRSVREALQDKRQSAQRTAADVANLAMMIYDRLEEDIRADDVWLETIPGMFYPPDSTPAA